MAYNRLHLENMIPIREQYYQAWYLRWAINEKDIKVQFKYHRFPLTGMKIYPLVSKILNFDTKIGNLLESWSDSFFWVMGER